MKFSIDLFELVKKYQTVGQPGQDALQQGSFNDFLDFIARRPLLVRDHLDSITDGPLLFYLKC